MTQSTGKSQRPLLGLVQVGPGWRTTLLIIVITLGIIAIALGAYFTWQSDESEAPAAASESTASELVDITEYPKPEPSVTHWTVYNGEMVQVTRPKDEVGSELRRLGGELETLVNSYCLLLVEHKENLEYYQPSEVLSATVQELRRVYTLQLVNYRLLLATERGPVHYREYLPLDEEVRYSDHRDCEPLQPERRGPVLGEA